MPKGPGRGAGGGRPPLPPEQRRTHRVHLSLSPDEQAALFEAAEKAGLRPATYGRELLLERLAAFDLAPSLSDEELAELRTHAEALNRATRRLHVQRKEQGAPLSGDDIAAEVADLVRRLRRDVRHARALLRAYREGAK